MEWEDLDCPEVEVGPELLEEDRVDLELDKLDGLDNV